MDSEGKKCCVIVNGKCVFPDGSTPKDGEDCCCIIDGKCVDCTSGCPPKVGSNKRVTCDEGSGCCKRAQ